MNINVYMYIYIYIYSCILNNERIRFVGPCASDLSMIIPAPRLQFVRSVSRRLHSPEFRIIYGEVL